MAASPPSAPSGGLAASLELIKSGQAALRQKQDQKKTKGAPQPLQRQPSSSMASVLRRRLEERKAAMGGSDDDEKMEGDADEWA